MANKKLFPKLCVLSLLGVFGLSACSSEVIAKPNGYDNETIVDFKNEGEKVYGNLLKDIYDEIRDGSLAGDVLNELLYQYSISVLGRYNKVISDKDVSPAISGETTLKEAARIAAKVKSNSATTAEVDTLNTFIQTHKAYWSVNAEGERTDDNNVVIADDTSKAGEKEIQRVLSKWDSIEGRIAKAMYDKIASNAYSYRNIFHERKLLIALRGDLYGVATYDKEESMLNAALEEGKLFQGLLDVSVEPEEVFDHFLHREYYQENFGLNDAETATQTINYVEDQIIPDIYRQLLVEQYLFDEAYYVLGRSSARKVNILAIAPTANEKYGEASNYLMNRFVEEYIFAKPNSANYSTIYDANLQNGVKDAFNEISDMWKGVNLSNDALLSEMQKDLRSFLVDNFAIESSSVEGETYYKGTEYGDLMEQYAKINPDPNKTDVEAESTFTASGTYTKETGLAIKTNELRLKTHVTSGWFIKDGGLTELPTSIKNRLFHNGVSIALDRKNPEENDRFDADGNYDSSRDYTDYVARINGKYFLTTTKSEGNTSSTEINAEDILFLDEATNTYYVVEIEEAVSSSKLSKNSTNSYASIYGDTGNEKMEEIVNNVAEVVGSGDSYQTLSKSHWLEEMNLEYHDEVIYDYFKTNFPDLFD